ncbi:MAG: hypothetical protein RIB93_26460, partial [Coleofasciculus sp. D1-CHI-01]|uniref:hypothetical protein n=1 Tax=Coleofasciculus sp. D1-CHI-01 TaxID=3068482 RepID=UPI0032F3943F
AIAHQSSQSCRGGFRDSIITHTANQTTKPALLHHQTTKSKSFTRSHTNPPNPVGAGLGIQSSHTPQTKQRNPPFSTTKPRNLNPSRDRTPILPIL